MKTLEEILAIPGIVVRYIPKTTVEKYKAAKGDFVRELAPNEWLESYSYGARQGPHAFLCKEVVNGLGGLYLVQIVASQYSRTDWNLRSCGVGETVQEAYRRYTDGIYGM